MLLFCGCSEAGDALDAGVSSARDGGTFGFRDAAVDGGSVFRGRGNRTYIHDPEPSIAPIDFSSTNILAIAGSADDLRLIEGQGAVDGTFEIRALPPGPLLVFFGSLDFGGAGHTTSSREIDVSSVALGRPDVNYTEDGTQLDLAISGLAPWQEDDRLGFAAANAGLMIGDLTFWSPRSPDTGTTAARLAIDFSYVPQIEANRGDQAIFTQLVSRRARDDLIYSAVERAASPVDFSIADATTTTLAIDLQEIATRRTVSIDWARRDIDALIEWAPDRAEIFPPFLLIAALPAYSEHGRYNNPAQLLNGRVEGRASTITATIGYASPFPASWDEYWSAAHGVGVLYTASGATRPAGLVAFSSQSALIDPSGRIEIRPKLSPIRELQIDGNDAFVDRDGIGTLPVLRWSPPMIGEPTGYIVIVFELIESDRDTVPLFLVEIATDDPELHFPPDLLRSGGEYVFEVVALESGASKISVAPYLYGPSSAYAEALSGIMRP